MRLKQLTGSSPKLDLSEHCSNLSPGTSEEPGASEESGTGTHLGYNEVMLDWVQEWDQKTRDLIKLDVVMYSEGMGKKVFLIIEIFSVGLLPLLSFQLVHLYIQF